MFNIGSKITLRSLPGVFSVVSFERVSKVKYKCQIYSLCLLRFKGVNFICQTKSHRLKDRHDKKLDAPNSIQGL